MTTFCPRPRTARWFRGPRRTERTTRRNGIVVVGAPNRGGIQAARATVVDAVGRYSREAVREATLVVFARRRRALPHPEQTRARPCGRDRSDSICGQREWRNVRMGTATLAGRAHSSVTSDAGSRKGPVGNTAAPRCSNTRTCSGLPCRTQTPRPPRRSSAFGALLGAEVVDVGPGSAHDEIVAAPFQPILPQVIRVESCGSSDADNSGLPQYAGGGLRDTTRRRQRIRMFGRPPREKPRRSARGAAQFSDELHRLKRTRESRYIENHRRSNAATSTGANFDR